MVVVVVVVLVVVVYHFDPGLLYCLLNSGNSDQLAFKHADQEFHYFQHTYFNTGIK